MSRALRRGLIPEAYDAVQAALAVDTGGDTQYGRWIQRYVGANDPTVRDLENIVETIVRIDELSRKLGEQPKLGSTVSPSVDALDERLRSLENSLDEFPDPERAEVAVLSPQVIITGNWDAAAYLHGVKSGRRFRPWCGGMSKRNFDKYGSDFKVRYIVLPRGPTTHVDINGTQVPWSDYAFAVSVDDRELVNINDPENNYPAAETFDRRGAEEALRILNGRLHLELGLDQLTTGRLWEEYDLVRTDWEPYNIGPEGAYELFHSYGIENGAEALDDSRPDVQDIVSGQAP